MSRMETTWASVISWARQTALPGASIDEAEARQALTRASESLRSASAAAAPDPAPRVDGDARQALLDAVYLVAAADGQISDEERGKVESVVGALFGGAVGAEEIGARLAAAREYIQTHGAVALTEVIAKTVTETDGRASILAYASAVGWLGRGIGAKEGLVLQALARAFGISVADLHKLMVVGKLA